MANNNYLMDEMDEDRVRKMYANRSILITGGTGFLGKILIEKFLRFVFYQTANTQNHIFLE